MCIKRDSARLVVLDHCLVKPDGHSMTLARAALDADPSAEVWANISCVIGDPRVRPVFLHSNMHPEVRFPAAPGRGTLKGLRFFLSILQRTIRANRSFASVLKSAGDSPRIWFVVNGSVRNVFALLWRCWRHPLDTGVCYLLQDPGRWLKLAEGVRRSLKARNFHFAAETAELAGNAGLMMGGQCRVLPFPVPGADHMPSRVAHRLPLVAGFLGMPRREKGFDVLIRAIGLLTEQMGSGILRFCLQAPAVYLEREAMKEELAVLRSLQSSGFAIECIEDELDPNAYQSFLQSCDFLVIPYRTAAYARRSSLVPIEGLIHGKPLVMTRGLLVTASLPPDCGIVEFPDGDSAALAGGIKEMLGSFEARAARTHAICPAWRHRYTGEGFLEALRQLTRA